MVQELVSATRATRRIIIIMEGHIIIGPFIITHTGIITALNLFIFTISRITDTDVITDITGDTAEYTGDTIITGRHATSKIILTAKKH